MLSADYDMLLVPGGARSMIKLAQTPAHEADRSAFVDDLKPVALLGHGVEVLVFADRAEGMTGIGALLTAARLWKQAKATWSEESLTIIPAMS